MSDYTTRADIVLMANGKQVVDELDRAKKHADELRRKLQEATAAGEKATVKKLNKELTEAEKHIATLGNAAEKTQQLMKRLDGTTPQKLKQDLRELKNGLTHIQRGSELWKEQKERIRLVQEEIKRVNNELYKTQSAFGRIRDWANKSWAAISGAVLIYQQVRAFVFDAVNAFATMDQEMANVRKYTNMTEAQVAELNEEFKKMDTRSSREELNRLAGEAGRLGKQSKEDVLGFVRAADQINVALDELGEGATLTLSKLTGIFGDEERLGTEKSLLSVGSAVNELAQNSRAGAPYLVEFASRMGGVGAQAGMTSAQVLGYGAVLDSYNHKVEASSTALSQVMVRIYREPAKYARVAGLDVQRFSELVKTDMNSALIEMLEALNKAGGMDVLSPMFKDMGENGSRAIQALSALASHIDEVKTRQQQATDAFNEATSVTKEFNVQNGTAQARLEKAKKRITELKVELGEKLMPVAAELLSHTKTLINTASFLTSVLKPFIPLIVNFARAWVSAKVAMAIAGATAAKAGQEIAKASLLTKIWGAVIMTLKSIGLVLQGTFFALSLQIGKAREAMRALNTTMKANVIGLVIGLVVTLGQWLYKLVTRTRELSAVEKERKKAAQDYGDVMKQVNSSTAEQIAKVRMLSAVVNDNNRTMGERKKAINELKKIVPGYNALIDEEKRTVKEATKAIEDYIGALKRKALAEAVQQKITQIAGEELDVETHKGGWMGALKGRKDALSLWDAEHKTYAKARDEIKAAIKGGEDGVIAQDRILRKYKIGQREFIKMYQERRDLLNNIAEARHKIAADDEVLATKNQRRDSLIHTAERLGLTIDDIVGDGSGNSGGGGGGGTTPTGDGGGTGGGKDDPDKDGKERFEAEKRWKEKEDALNSLAYAKGERSLRAYKLRQWKIEEEYYNRILARTELSEQERLNIEVEQAEKARSKRKELAKWTVEAENIHYNELQAREKQRYIDGEIDKETYDAVMERLEEAHWLNMVQMCEKGSDDYNKALEKHRDISIKNMEKRKKATEDAEKKKAEEAKKRDQELADVKDTYFGDSAAEKREKYAQARSRLDTVYKQQMEGAGDDEKEKKRINKAYSEAKVALGNMYDQQVEDDTRSGFERSITGIADWLQSDGGKMLTESLQFVVQGMGEVFSGLTSIVQAELEIQSAAIEKRYDREISAAEGNNYKVKQLERQKEKELAKAKKEANRKAFVMQVMQAVASTAQGAINAYTSAAALPPPLGQTLPPIAAAMALAAGAIQIAAIKKQQQASEATGYAQGGFTPAGRVDEEVGVVHAGEWVASQRLLANPRARAIINTLDYAQRTNTIGSLSEADVSRSITAPSVLAGAVSSEGGSLVVQGLEAQAVALTVYADTMRRLQERLEEPFVTVNTVTGDTGIKRAQDEYERLMKNKSPRRR